MAFNLLHLLKYRSDPQLRIGFLPVVRVCSIGDKSSVEPIWTVGTENIRSHVSR